MNASFSCFFDVNLYKTLINDKKTPLNNIRGEEKCHFIITFGLCHSIFKH